MFNDSQSVINFVKEKNIRFIDVRFSDLYGTMQHLTIPTNMLEETLTDGMMFDGSSINGFTAIHESDMKLIPDPTAAFVDPFRREPTLVLYSSIVDPFTNEPFSRDPRGVTQKAEAYLKSTGIADTAFLAPEPACPHSGLGMKVTVLPSSIALFFTMYLNTVRLSAACSSVE